MQVGTTKDQGLYNKPWAAMHPGALAAGTLPQYNTVYIRPAKLLSLSEEFLQNLAGMRVTWSSAREVFTV